MPMFKLALIQMRVEGGAKQRNLDHAAALIAEAAAHGSALAVLPEALSLGWTHPSAKVEADELPDGPSCSVLRNMARETGLYLCSGLVERADDRIFNAAVVIDPQGDVILHHRKIHELEIGHALYALGDRLEVAHTSLGTIGLMICADAFARGQVISRTLGYMGAQIILSPSAWAVPADHDNEKEPYGALWLENYAPVARDFRLWIVGVSNVGWITGGPWQGRKCIGCSLVVDPSGEPVLRGPYGAEAEAILYVDVALQPRPAQGEGWTDYWAMTQRSGG
ncbi:MAG: carbon-nitrogen hydrolase family protein [Chloroflexi bacterium]|nr:carbon-nitrogen hydrolase family protein [Chloroflexota bacterium]